MRRQDLRFLCGLILLSWAWARGAIADESDDRYYTIDLEEVSLRLVQKDRLAPTAATLKRYYGLLQPYVVLDGMPKRSEAYVAQGGTRPTWARLAVRVPHGKRVSGLLFWPHRDATLQMVRYRFEVPRDRASQSPNDFHRVKLKYYEALLQRDIPGGAWFRHQARLAQAKLGAKYTFRSRTQRFFTTYDNSLESTYSLLSGGRALSENLQLDREIPSTTDGVETIAIDKLKGITVREFDWSSYVKEINPQLDALAKAIPHDQHALFARDFQATAGLLNQYSLHGSVVLSLGAPRAVDIDLQSLYEQQLGVSMQEALRQLQPLVKSVAATGGDAYFDEGTDLALLMQARGSADRLREIVERMVSASSSSKPQVKQSKGNIGGITFRSWRNPDRSVSSYVAAIDDVVIVSNSPVQLRRVVRTLQGDKKSYDALDEYRYFRHRYKIDDADESALLVITDATIRRWCGPRWRIAASRRTRAVSTMAEVQANQLTALIRGKVQLGRQVQFTDRWHEAGRITATESGVLSNRFGTLRFQTPIAELELTQVKTREAFLYRRWRDGYQRNWSNYFDPIALRLSVDDKKVAADVTVMPLIDSTEYKEWSSITRGVEMKAGDGDPHPEALLHLAMTVNKSSVALAYGRRTIRSLIPTLKRDPLAWMGRSVAVYIDDAPIWEELSKMKRGDALSFVLTNFNKFPIAIHADVSNGMYLTLFLAGLRGYIEQTAPGMTEWKTLTYKETRYVRVGLAEQGKSGSGYDHLALYYAASGKSFLATINEDLLKRAIDRQLKRQEKSKAAVASKEPAQRYRWLGKNVNVQVKPKLATMVHPLFDTSYRKQMQRLSWNNLPILNEWKRRYPDSDPLQIHQRYWNQKLVCPGGGTYRWNAKWQTMESSVFGHPGQPLEGPDLPASLQNVRFGNFGLTFEDNGLRARIELQQK